MRPASRQPKPLSVLQAAFLLRFGYVDSDTVAMGFLLMFPQDSNEEEYVEIGLSCADICRALDRGLGGKRLDDLNQSVCEAINQLTT